MITAVDILAAKATGAALAKRYSADALFRAHMRHKGILALRYGFLAAHADALIKGKFK